MNFPKPQKREKARKPLRRGKPLRAFVFRMCVCGHTAKRHDTFNHTCRDCNGPFCYGPRPTEAALRRGKPLRRSWMRKKAPRRIDRETPAEKYYKAWIHTQRRTVCGAGRLVQQSHERDMTGMALKEDNFRSLAMCGSCHVFWTNNDHRFGATKEDRKAWFRCRILLAHAEFILQHGCNPEDYEPPTERKT